MKKMNLKKAMSMLMVSALVAMGTVGCSNNSDSVGETGQTGEAEAPESSAAVAEAGTPLEQINPDDIALTVGDYQMPASELFYLYYSTKLTYEMSYGFTDWSQEIMEGYTYADYLKSTVESQAMNIVYLTTLAEEKGIGLTDEEKTSAAENAQMAIDSLTEEEIAAFGFTVENMTVAAEHMYLASDTMNVIQEEAVANLTEEEKASCQYRSIQHILISTMDTTVTNEDGESETMDEAAESEYRAAQLELAQEVLERAKSGEDFEALANEFTADSGVGYSINADGQTPDGATMVTEFAEAANALGEGEISDLVETVYGYHIIKCISLNDEAAQQEAEMNLAYNNASNAYTEWFQSVEYSFYDTWVNYVIVNPSTEDTIDDDVNSSESES